MSGCEKEGVLPMSNQEAAGIKPGLVWLMAAATGIAAASNYYAQPLLHTIAGDLGLSVAAAGTIVTTAQVAYGLGLLFLVPLGDLLDRRWLIALMSLMSAAGLAVSATADSLWQLLLGTAISSLFAVVAQILVPFSATLAAPHERGKVVGTVMSGLLLGILLARTFAGAVASFGDWRLVYWFACVLVVATAAVLARALPRHPVQAAGMSYGQLFSSIGSMLAHESVLRTRCLLGGISFAGFAILWTSMAFLLSAPPFEYSVFTIGLFGLAGAAGAFGATRVGRLADRGKGELAARIGLWTMLVSWIPLGLAKSSVLVLIVGIVLLDLAAQCIHISNQHAIYRIRPEARSRLTAAYMTCYFIGGSLGSLASASAFALAGWNGVVAVGAVVAAMGIGAWAMRPRTAP
jgi:predicted MFS family arabinose efflux permease